MNCTEANRLLGAYVDGELELRPALEIEAHLQACPRCRAAESGVSALRTALARACAPAMAPARLHAAVRTQLAGAAIGDPRRSRRGWLAAAPGIAALLLVGGILIVQPWPPQRTDAAADGTRVVYHIAGNENFDASLRTLKNHLDAAPGLKVIVVAHNNGIEFLLQGAADSAGQPYVMALRDLRHRGVEFRVCTNTLTRRQIDTRSVVPEAVLVPSGIAEISRLQGQEGYTYLRL
jgi:hypothetical protein